LISPDTCELRYPGSRWLATAVVDAGDGEAKAGPFGPGSGGVRRVRARALGNPRSRRPRVLSGGQEGIKEPVLLHRACACTGIQHSRGRGITAMLAKLRRSRATMASGGNRKRMATTFGSAGRRCRCGRRDEGSVRHGGAWARGPARRGRWRAT